MREKEITHGKLIKVKTVFIFILVIFFASTAYSKIIRSTHEDISLKKEIERTISNGLGFLKKNQNKDGSWSTPDFPALTGLVLYAFLTSDDYKNVSPKPKFIIEGLDFIIKNVKDNGSICKEGLPNYNTTICIMALAAAKDSKYYPYIIKARHYLASLQMDKGEKGVADEVYDGGVGYGTKEHSDLSNTYLAIESLKITDFLESDQYVKLYADFKNIKKQTLNWQAALKFIERCQNLPEYNDQAWASGDEKNKGGFVYFPGNSKAGEETLPDGNVALRSYGSMTYAGLLSFIYADLKKDDPRVTAAYEWIKNNYTLKENPGMNQQGLYYYYHTMAKALTVLGDDYLVTKDGKSIDWRKDLTVQLVNKQKGDGSWINVSGRWWENDPVLVTAYSLIALNMIDF